MKVLLGLPNQLIRLDGMKARPAVSPPLGVLSIAAYLRESDWQGTIEIYDARLGATFRREADYWLFGDSDERIEARIRAAAPDVIGISNLFSSQIDRAYRFAELAKRAAPNATVVIGGPHVSVFPLEAIARPDIDYAVIGEGEERFTQLLLALQRGDSAPKIQGVVATPADLDLLRSNPRAPVGFTDPLDSLPLPAYDLVDMPRYFALARKGLSPRFREWGKRPISMLTSRGCPHKCVFCSIQTTMGYKFRAHSPEYTRRHIRHLVDEYGVDFIHFEDDNLVHDTGRYDEIIDFMSTFQPRIKWDTPNGVRGDAWTLDRARRAKASGCQFLTVAIESGVQRVLDDIVRKRLDLARVDDMMRYCRQVGLRLHAFYIIGFPGETLADIRATVDYALDRYRRYGVVPMLQPLIPIPGTDVYDQIANEGWHEGSIATEYNQVKTAEFDPATLQAIYRDYLRKRLLIFALRSLIVPKELLYNLKLILKYPGGAYYALRNALRANG
ncbi:B12-binding domain-containing radical SAM protein [Methylomonas sp. MED-D]|uniref:B12-binding domain-containing radical SAM protein n=1 Tax=unclassified Methylomonas TaxID=2608980 RepID=UPI003CFD0862